MKNNKKYTRSSGGAKIYYESNVTNPKEPCLVFVHGLAGAAPVWEKETIFFKEEGIASIALDLRGHGLSERSEKNDFYKFDNFVNDVKQVIAAEKIESYSLIGHCLGGMVSLGIAASKPKGLKCLVLIDSIYKTPAMLENFENAPLFKSILKFLAKNAPDLKIPGHEDYQSFKGTGSLDLKRGISDVLHVSLRNYFLICEDLMDISIEKLLSKISVPTLIIEGSKDTVVRPNIAKELKGRIKNSELDMIPGANHFLIVNNPLHVSREIERFLIKQKFI